TYTNPFCSGRSVGTGSLVVNKATPTINWATPADITYGTALSGTQLNATATFKNNPVAGTFTYTPADGTVLNAGQNQNLHVDFAPTDSANFNGASKNVSINVTQAALTVTANDQTKTYADPNPTFTVSRTGFVNGDGAGTLGGTHAASSESHRQHDRRRDADGRAQLRRRRQPYRQQRLEELHDRPGRLDNYGDLPGERDLRWHGADAVHGVGDGGGRPETGVD